MLPLFQTKPCFGQRPAIPVPINPTAIGILCCLAKRPKGKHKGQPYVRYLRRSAAVPSLPVNCCG